MRKIDSIIIHCSATKAGVNFTATDIDRWHHERGFNGIGYHYIIRLDGTLEKGRDIALTGAHCKGWNERSIGICYIGGLDASGNPADTRTNAQKRILYQLIMDLQREYGILQVLGHRDTSPDLNGDGIIEPYEYIKSCPCFDVKEFLRSGRELLFIFLMPLIIPLFLSCKSSKKVTSTSNRIQTDSISTTTRESYAIQKGAIFEEMTEQIMQQVEQTLILFPTKDSSEVKPKILLRSITQKTQEKELKKFSGETIIKNDSLSEYHKEKKHKEEIKKESESVKQSELWRNICKITCIIIVSLVCYIRFRKK